MIKDDPIGLRPAGQDENEQNCHLEIPRIPIARLTAPAATQPFRVNWPYTASLTLIHVFALTALVPWLFSWTGVFLFLFGHFFFGMLGITIGYHRLLTHRGFECPKWLEHTLATIGVCCLQDSPAKWVAIHRMHHQHSDERPDPHSPLVSFVWSHVGWLLVQSRDHDELGHFERYARDILRDPYYMRLERHQFWIWIYAIHAVLFFIVGMMAGLAMTGQIWAGIQLGLSWMVWGVFVRTVVVMHATWAVNSVTHVWGYRNYNTADDSRNNPLISLLTHGEGWHNNHHADQRSAAHGHKWWEFDLSYRTIRLLERVHLAWNVVNSGKTSRLRKKPNT